MIKLESVLEDQYPELADEVILRIQGPPESRLERVTVAPRGYTPRGSQMALWAWQLQGRRVKTLQNDLATLTVDLSNGLGIARAKPAYRCLERAESAILRGKSTLEDVLVKQHPDYREFETVFFGTGTHFEPIPFDASGRIDYSRLPEEELGIIRLAPAAPQKEADHVM
jgi:hypothetical protein